MNDVHIAWAAGLFEGEGSISPHGNGFRCAVEMTDKDIIERLQQMFPGPSVGYRQRENWKPTWLWRINKTKDIQSFLSKILPYLGNRRAYSALNALDQIELN